MDEVIRSKLVEEGNIQSNLCPGEDEKKRSRKIVGINRAGYKKNIWPKRTINKDVFCHAVFF